MRTPYIFLLLSALSIMNIQAQTFNWEEQIITDRNETIQGFAPAEDGSATIIGFGNIFSRTTDGGESWQDAGIFTGLDAFDYQDISFSGTTGYAVAMTKFKVIDHPAGASHDLYANSPLLKTEDGGISWSLISLETMGSGTDSTLNASALGNSFVKYTSVEAISADTAYVGIYWKDVNSAVHQNVFKTIDGGESWEAILPDNGSKSISYMTVHKSHIYIAGSKTLFKVNTTTDAVTNLHPIIDEGEDDGMYFWDMSVYGDELIIPTTGDGIFVTDDEGASFSIIPNTTKAYAFYKHDANNMIALAGKNDTKATNDGGQTWTSISAGESLWNYAVIGDSIVALAKKEIYTMALSDIANGQFEWTSKPITDINGNIKAIDTVGDTVYVTGYADLFLRSTDGAQTFTEVTLPSKSDLVYNGVDIEMIGLAQGKGKSGIASTRRHKLVDYPSSGPADIYRSGFIFKTEENWATYSVVDNTLIGDKYGDNATINPNATGCYGQDFGTVECIDDTTFYTFVQWYDTLGTESKIIRGAVYKTIDGGISWDTIITNLDAKYVYGIDFKSNSGYIYGSKICLQIDKNDGTITDLYTKLTDLGAKTPSISEVTELGDHLYIMTTAKGAYISSDNGETFATINDIAGATGFVILDDNSWMTLGSSSKTRYSNDAGTTWTNCYPGSTTFSYGGIYNGDIIALCKSKIYKQSIADLDITASSLDNTKAQATINLSQTGQELQLTADHAITDCIVYSITGQVMHKSTPNSEDYSINTSSFANGIYIIFAKSNGVNNSYKVIID